MNDNHEVGCDFSIDEDARPVFCNANNITAGSKRIIDTLK